MGHAGELSLIYLNVRQLLLTAAYTSSLDNNIEELIPIGGLEAAQLHGQALDFSDHLDLQVQVFVQLLVGRSERHFDDALLEQVVELITAVLAAQVRVQSPQFNHLFALISFSVVHVWVKYTADLLVVVLQRLENQQRGDVKEDLGVPLLELLRELLMLLACSLDHLREVK